MVKNTHTRARAHTHTHKHILLYVYILDIYPILSVICNIYDGYMYSSLSVQLCHIFACVSEIATLLLIPISIGIRNVIVRRCIIINPPHWVVLNVNMFLGMIIALLNFLQVWMVISIILSKSLE